MSQQPISRLIVAIVEDLDGVRVMPSPYSGRGMYGMTCVAFSLETSITPLQVFGRILEWSDRLPAEDREEVIANLIALTEDARTDNLGLGTVLYFPDFCKPE